MKIPQNGGIKSCKLRTTQQLSLPSPNVIILRLIFYNKYDSKFSFIDIANTLC